MTTKAKPETRDIRSDMLAQASSVQETLRAMYLYGVDYMLLLQGKSERLVHKEQLVALLEQGRDRATLEDIFSMTLHEPLSAKMQMEDIPPATPLLLFTAGVGDASGQLEKLSFAEFRQRKLDAEAVAFPEWWSVPLPLVHIDEDRVYLNPQGERTIPGGAASLAGQIERMRRERIASIKERKAERTFSLYPLGEDTFFAEDISGDFEMAEDLVWWAAIGKAFVGRMKENGLVVRRLSPYEDPPSAATEIIPCSWEGELIGRLAIEVPAGTPTEEPPQAKRESAPKASRAKPVAPAPSSEIAPKVVREAAFDEMERELLSETTQVEIKEPESESINMKRTAARSAYGMKGKKPAAKAEKVEGTEEIAKNAKNVKKTPEAEDAAKPKKRAKSG